MTFSSTLFRMFFSIDSPPLDIDEVTDANGIKQFRLSYGPHTVYAGSFYDLLNESEFLSDEQKEKIIKEYGS